MSTGKKISLFQAHCERWKSGCGSDYCSRAMKRTFYRGAIPADILFVGEAPGKSENVIGQPFIGPAGKLLDRIISNAVPAFCQHKKRPCTAPQAEGLTECALCGEYEAGLDGPCRPYRIGFTNLVICIPRDEEDNQKIEPDDDQIRSCKKRLEDIIQIASPRLIFAVGSQARDNMVQGYMHSPKIPSGCRIVHIVHPAYILRQTTAFQGLEMQRTVHDIRDAIREMEKAPSVKKTSTNTQREISDILPYVDETDIPF